MVREASSSSIPFPLREVDQGFSRKRFVSLGRCGWVFKLNEFVVVKKVRPGEDGDLANEKAVFDLLELHPPSPYIVQRFYRLPDAIFFERAPLADLASLLRDNQLRGKSSDRHRVVGIKTLQPLDRCYKWMKQLVSAAAWLEELGYAHCDIRPPNMLLFDHDDIKLADFDRTTKIGEEGVLTEPFARRLTKYERMCEDSLLYGKVGCRTEQFAIGSAFYSPTRGYDLYDDEDFGAEHQLVMWDKLTKKEFPAIGDLECDEIVGNCWNNHYISIKELLQVIMAIDGMA
ncbi:hypothetical protein PT974_07351 [Cladobotryum mycophilum]|uniref:Protein kinase domain-containing protein n=1 Tax=Cladobotryum mycophilum TaxID=491253 RepID=A0ABR0SP03_9HYPO